jgi:hypothetical protein
MGIDINVHGKTDRADKPLTRVDVEYLLHQVGSPEKLDLSKANMTGIDLSFSTSQELCCDGLIYKKPIFEVPIFTWQIYTERI